MTDSPKKTGWLARLKGGLSKSTHKITDSITSLISKRKLDDEVLEELEEILITADLGPSTAMQLVSDFGKTRFGKEVSDQEIKEALSEQITNILDPCAKPLEINAEHTPFVILMVGVNGAGKTTTLGKMANQYVKEGKSVMLAAADTFRAAAISQLQIWGERTGCEVIAGDHGSDPAALAYRALEKAKSDGTDILMIDTAGRLQNKTDLMEELSKITRVIKKIEPSAPHATLLVLDATTGQNAFAQVDVFKELTHVTGLIVTKLDGSAKGGVIVGLADKFKLPIHAIGVGESLEDLHSFKANDFANSLMDV